MTILGDAAVALAAHGWHVFPLGPGGKKPFGKTHTCLAPLHQHGFKDATTDPETVQEWWRQHPTANIGVATEAASGITVLDVDVKPWQGKTGDQSLAALVEAHGDLPVTPMQYTWSGGMQYVFAHVPGLANSSGRLGKDLDVRGVGGYIVAPPSLVEEDGRSGEYVWDVYAAYDEIPSAAMPGWMVLRLTTPETPETPGGARQNVPGWAEPFIDGVSQGSRNETAWRLTNRYALLHLSEREVRLTMRAWAATCVPPFDPAVIDEQVERAFTRLGSKATLSLPSSDAGNAERMVLLEGERFRWVLGGRRGEWLAWDGRRWAPESDEAVKGIALDAARALGVAAIRLPSDDARRQALIKYALKSESARGVDDAAKMAKLLGAVQVRREQLDVDPEVLNLANGTLDLKTSELRPHNPDDLLTKLINVAYDPGARAPRWERFLDQVFLGREDLIDYVQRAVGYTLTGLTIEQLFFFLYGAGANGKSTMTEVLGCLFGDYGVKITQEALLTQGKKHGKPGATPEIMPLVGARFAYVDEIDEERQLDEARIKSLTGGATETGRQLYKGMHTWRNTAKIWFDVNALPSFKGIDEGIARRPKVVPFNRKFEEPEQDKRLAEKLKAELPGILAWAVEGCRLWRQRGLKVREPESVSTASGSYTDSQNHLPRFMADTFIKAPEGRVLESVVTSAYNAWCGAEGETLMAQGAVRNFIERTWKCRRTKMRGTRLWVGMSAKKQANPGEWGGVGRASTTSPKDDALEESLRSTPHHAPRPPLSPAEEGMIRRMRAIRLDCRQKPRRAAS